MAHSPLVTYLINPPAGVDWTPIISIATVITTQVVAIGIFLKTLKEARRSEHNKRVKDTRKDVLLEVAPHVQKVYASLAELINPTTKLEEWNARLAAGAGAVAKLTAVATDETLTAARDLMTAMGLVMIRIMNKRVELATDPEASKKLFLYWREQVAPIPDLLANFTEKARQEIELDLDKKKLADGLKATNKLMYDELEQLMLTVEKQQAGGNQGTQLRQVEAPKLPVPQSNQAHGHDAQDGQLTQEQIQALFQEVAQLRQQVLVWQYRFFNKFFVHRTQWVLDWLIDRQSKGLQTSLGLLDAELSARVVAPQERVAVFQALEAHGLVVNDNGMATVTDKGVDYAKWRGPLPQLPPPQP